MLYIKKTMSEFLERPNVIYTIFYIVNLISNRIPLEHFKNI